MELEKRHPRTWRENDEKQRGRARRTMTLGNNNKRAIGRLAGKKGDHQNVTIIVVEKRKMALLLLSIYESRHNRPMPSSSNNVGTKRVGMIIILGSNANHPQMKRN